MPFSKIMPTSPTKAGTDEEDESRPLLQCLASEVRLCRDFKAQGGQWKNVFLDQGYMTDEPDTRLFPLALHRLYPCHERSTVNYRKNK